MGQACRSLRNVRELDDVVRKSPGLKSLERAAGCVGRGGQPRGRSDTVSGTRTTGSGIPAVEVGSTSTTF